jgi:hypothetical protein
LDQDKRKPGVSRNFGFRWQLVSSQLSWADFVENVSARIAPQESNFSDETGKWQFPSRVRSGSD